MSKLKNDFLAHSGLMFMATAVVNLSNMLYHLFMVRNLSPADYAAVNSLVAIIVIVSVPIGTIQTGLINFVSKFFAHQQFGKIKYILKEISKHISVAIVIVLLALMLGSNAIANFLRIDSATPVILIAWSLLFSALAPISLAGLQGVQKFISLAIIMIIAGSSKLIISAIMVWLHYGLNGAISGFIVSSVLTFFISLFSLRSILKYKSESEKGITKELYLYFLPVGISLFCLTAITNFDVILVKHFFDPIEAGYYSIASLVGKIILFLPGAITMVMFPKTSYLISQGKKPEALNLVKQSLKYAALLCGSAALVCIFFTPLIIKLLTGQVYAQSLPLAKMFAIAMFFFAMFSIILYYQLSSGSTSFIYPLVFFTILQLALIFIFHNTLMQVISILAINSFMLFLVNLKLIFKKAALS